LQCGFVAGGNVGLKPWGESTEETTEGLEVRGLDPLLLEAGTRFYGHGGAELLLAYCFEDGMRDAVHDFDPVGAVAGASDTRLL
jgi:hypothetical protein